MKLIVLPELFGICKFEPDADLPEWISQNGFTSVTRTVDELSIVTVESAIPKAVECERDWRCFKVEGPLDFSLTGVLASLASPLTEAEISIFAVSTYDTDYLLVKEVQFREAKRVLTKAGHQVESNKDEGAV